MPIDEVIEEAQERANRATAVLDAHARELAANRTRWQRIRLADRPTL